MEHARLLRYLSVSALCRKVYLRIRPLSEDETRRGEHDEICFLDATTVALKAKDGSSQPFSFTQALDSRASQEEVYHATTRPMVLDAVQGKNGLLFTYGITNSGKTHTMLGAPADPGLVPRVMTGIFEGIGNALAPPFTLYSDQLNQIFIQARIVRHGSTSA